VLSFPIPDAIPRNAIVQEAQLTLVQLPSNDLATIPGFGDRGRGFFFLDATPHNLAANSVVLQEVRLGAVDNVPFSDFFAPAISGFVALGFTGNALGGDTSAGPQVADVRFGVQRAVSAQGPRFYQVRLQCAREVWNNQATSVFPSLSFSVSSSVSGTAIGAPVFQAVAPIRVGFSGSANAGISTYQVNAANPVTVTATLLVTNPITVSFDAAGTIFTTSLPTRSTTISVAGLLANQFAPGSFSFEGPYAPENNYALTITSLTNLDPVNLAALIPNRVFSYTASFSVSFSTSASVAGTPANSAGFEISQGATGTCRAEFDREPATGTGDGPITTARGPRLDITFTVPR
jgi:hypothetical protein